MSGERAKSGGQLHFDCMDRSSQLVKAAVARSSHPHMYVFDQAHIYQMFGNATGEWSMHRPEWVIDIIWHYIAAIVQEAASGGCRSFATFVRSRHVKREGDC